MRKQLFKLTAAVAGLAIGSAPIAIYISTFGTTISSDHGRWAEMGSAMAGIYAPALSAITAYLLYNQLKLLQTQHALQVEQHKVQVRLVEQQILEGVISSRTEQLKEHLSKLEALIKGATPQEKLKDAGLHGFYYKSGPTLKSMKELAQAKYLGNPSLLDAWVGIYSALEGLKDYDHPTIRALHPSLHLRVVTSLSVPVVHALDNWHYAMNANELDYLSGGPDN